MKTIADIYVAELLRAVFGPGSHSSKVDNPTRLRQIAEHLADSELAQSALQAKGYGRGSCTFLELTREVPNYTPGMLVRMFAPRTPASYPIPASRRTA